MINGIDMSLYLKQNEQWLDGKVDGYLTNEEVSTFFSNGHLQNDTGEEGDTFISSKDFDHWYSQNRGAITNFLNTHYNGLEYSDNETKASIYKGIIALSQSFLPYDNDKSSGDESTNTQLFINNRTEVDIKNLEFDDYRYEKVLVDAGEGLEQLKKAVIQSNGEEAEIKYYLSYHDKNNEGAENEEIEIENPLENSAAINAMWQAKNSKISINLLDNIRNNTNISNSDRINILYEAMERDPQIGKDWCKSNDDLIIGMYEKALNEILTDINVTTDADELIALKHKCEKYTTKKMEDYTNFFTSICNAIYNRGINWSEEDLDKLKNEFPV